MEHRSPFKTRATFDIGSANGAGGMPAPPPDKMSPGAGYSPMHHRATTLSSFTRTSSFSIAPCVGSPLRRLRMAKASFWFRQSRTGTLFARG